MISAINLSFENLMGIMLGLVFFLVYLTAMITGACELLGGNRFIDPNNMGKVKKFSKDQSNFHPSFNKDMFFGGKGRNR